MDGILKIQENMSESIYFDMYKKAIIDHQSFRLAQIKSTDSIVQSITQKLGKSQSQHEGLVLLHCLLDQCNLDVIAQKSNIWIATCIKICNQCKKDLIVSLGYDILGILIQKSSDIPELGRSFSNNFIAKICETFNNIESGSFLPALKCLFICLKYYPGSCGGSIRNIIENFLVKNFVDCNDENFIKWSGKCFHLLQQVRGGGVQGISHKASWKVYQLKLIGSLHNILDLTFANCPEFYDPGLNNDSMVLNPLNLNNDPIIRAGQLSTRFKYLTNCLVIAIRDSFPVSKAIQPTKILNLIARGLSITCEILQRNAILDNIAIGAILPVIHVELYKLLETLILVLKNHLNIFHKQILGIFLDTLKWTCSGKSEGFKKSYSELRCITYKTLSTWCQTMKFGSCVETIFDHIFKHIDSDITPFRTEITLKVLSGARKHMSKKARQQLHKAENEKSHLGQTHMKNLDSQKTKIVYQDYENKNVCFSALVAFKNIYTYNSIFLKPLVIKDIQEKFIDICLSLNEVQYLKSALYSNSLCREKMYDALNCLIIAPHNLSPPPTQLIIQLLTIGKINDYNKNVRNCCGEHLNSMENIFHPQKKCLYFPPELINIKLALRTRQSLLSESEHDDVNNETLSAEVGSKSENMELQKILQEENKEENKENKMANAFTSQMSNNLIIESNITSNINDNQVEKSNSLKNHQNVNDLEISIFLEDNNSNSTENFEESIKNILNVNKAAISCPKKRLLQNLHKFSEDGEIESKEIDIEKSPKRAKTENSTVDFEGSNNEDTSKNFDKIDEELKKNENLFEEIFATFTDELRKNC